MQNLRAIGEENYWCFIDGTDVLYNKFNVDGSSPPDNPPQRPNSNYSCVVATTGHWKVSRCDDRHQVVCQSDHDTLPASPATGIVITYQFCKCCHLPLITFGGFESRDFKYV